MWSTRFDGAKQSIYMFYFSYISLTTSNPNNPVFLTSASTVRIDFGVSSVMLHLSWE